MSHPLIEKIIISIITKIKIWTFIQVTGGLSVHVYKTKTVHKNKYKGVNSESGEKRVKCKNYSCWLFLLYLIASLYVGSIAVIQENMGFQPDCLIVFQVLPTLLWPWANYVYSLCAIIKKNYLVSVYMCVLWRFPGTW